MAKKNHTERARRRWIRKINKKKQKEDAGFARMYQLSRITRR